MKHFVLLIAFLSMTSCALFKRGDKKVEYRTADEVAAVMEFTKGQMLFFYERYEKQKENLTGEISLEITISDLGFVENVKTIDTNLNKEFVYEIVNVVKQAEFGAKGEGSTIYTYRYLFEPGE